MKVGCNASYFNDFTSAGIRPQGQRIYLNTTSTSPGPIPAMWPELPSGVRAAVSIRPDCAKVIAGDLDNELTQFLKSAPGGDQSLLGLWHEASSQNYPGLQSGNLKSAQQYIQALSKSLNTSVKVGAIENVGITDPGVWMAKDLDFYACDAYDNSNGNADLSTMLFGFQSAAATRMTSGNPVIAITECNSRFTKRRPYWFNTSQSWLQGHANAGWVTLLTYWNPNGIQSGDWDPNDTATIAALTKICNDEYNTG